MKFSYKFANVLGSVYHKGTLEFSPDGNSVLSPVGNKVVTYDLKNNRSQGVPIEVEYNLNHICLSPNGSLLLAATERTQLYIFSMVSGVVLHRKDFKKLEQITALGFSPNGKYYVVCGGMKALVYLTPGIAFNNRQRELSPFKIHKVVKAHYDDTTCIAWSSDSRLLAIGSKDLTVKIVTVEQEKIFNIPGFISISGHSDVVTKCFFAAETSTNLDLFTLSINCQICVWKANMTVEELIAENSTDSTNEVKLLSYSKENRFNFNESLKCKNQTLKLTSADYNAKRKLLVTGFSNGAFLLHEMPEFSLVYSLELSTSGAIDSIRINSTGDWIALASGVTTGSHEGAEVGRSSQSQLVIWEWQSETFILKQSGTGAGLSNLTECVAYSPDGSFLATGNTDGKIKLWNTFTNFCFATFAEEHKGPITALEFVPNKGGKVLLSASLDGTVRAYDMNRYRNFRTLSAPSDSKPAQFTCLAVDSVGGDFVAAGSQNLFEIFLWSLQTGRLLECLTGHEGPVSGVQFSPTTNSLVSCSWDGIVRIWELFEGSKCTREIVTLGSDAIALTIRPDGEEFAVSSINGNVSFFNTHSGEQNGVGIEGRFDLGMNQSETELIRDKEKFFTTLHYSGDGEYIICGGKSKYICIYHVAEKMLVKKFPVTWNLSMDGMYDFISKRKVAEFGFAADKVNSREEGKELASINLPGVKKGDFSSRTVSPMIAVMSLQFSPTMRSFAASTTEGVLIYSLDVGNNFDPYQLEVDITEESVRKAIMRQEFGEALMQAIKLNESPLITEVFENIPLKDISFVSSSLPITYVEKCFRHIACALENTAHLEFYITWCHTLLQHHGVVLKNGFSASTSLMSSLRLMQRNLTKHFEDVGKICDYNKYFLKFLQSAISEPEKVDQL